MSKTPARPDTARAINARNSPGVYARRIDWRPSSVNWMRLYPVVSASLYFTVPRNMSSEESAELSSQEI